MNDTKNLFQSSNNLQATEIERVKSAFRQELDKLIEAHRRYKEHEMARKIMSTSELLEAIERAEKDNNLITIKQETGSNLEVLGETGNIAQENTNEG
ncbi:MAG: hypothetical protein K0R02_275 [Rickettsiaceae bacterium]|jgi:hypothetical protein|nr:hypothetical protein [Rickettsiaceae bacterium]